MAFFIASPALARLPSVAALDAHSRASGNRIAVAQAVGGRLFTTVWPVQVLQVIASQMGSHLVLGMRLSGVKFHAPTAKAQFDAEIVDIVGRAFAVDPRVEEADIWVTVPLDVGKGLVVSGDLAVPTNRTVFTISVHRGEVPAVLTKRLSAGTGVFLDPEWARSAFAKR